MGLELESKTTVKSGKAYHIAKAAIESIVSKLGIASDVEEHVKNLAELVGTTRDVCSTSTIFAGPFTFTVDDVEITIRDIYYDPYADECDYLDCEGTITVRYEVDGNIDKMRQIVIRLLKKIGADKYVKICE